MRAGGKAVKQETALTHKQRWYGDASVLPPRPHASADRFVDLELGKLRFGQMLTAEFLRQETKRSEPSHVE